MAARYVAALRLNGNPTRNFNECEHYFGRVIAAGDRLQAAGKGPTRVIGNSLDEREWPLALIRAWGHLGLAFSYVERDGDLATALDEITAARSHAEKILRPDRFPTRIKAACTDCEGLISLKNEEITDAIDLFEHAVREFPYSRSYIDLAYAYVERSRQGAVDRASDLRAARRALKHAVNLTPGDEPVDVVQEVLKEIDALGATAR